MISCRSTTPDVHPVSQRHPATTVPESLVKYVCARLSGSDILRQTQRIVSLPVTYPQVCYLCVCILMYSQVCYLCLYLLRILRCVFYSTTFHAFSSVLYLPITFMHSKSCYLCVCIFVHLPFMHSQLCYHCV